MNEMPQFETKNEQENKPEIYSDARKKMTILVENSENFQKAIETTLNRLEPFFKHIDKDVLSIEQIEEMRQALSACATIEDKTELIDAIVEAIKPLLDVQINNLSEFEKAQAKSMNELGGFTEINRLLSYGKSGNIIHFHAPAGKTVENKLSLYRQGMRDLAKIVAADPEVTEITATSNIVAEHPEIFTMMGFSVSEITPEARAKYFPNTTEPISRAEISREDFLNKFLKK